MNKLAFCTCFWVGHRNDRNEPRIVMVYKSRPLIWDVKIEPQELGDDNK